MKNQYYFTVLIWFLLYGPILYAQTYSYEARMTNFEQVSEMEFQFDIELRNNSSSPLVNKWAYNSSQFQIDINTDLMNGGQFSNTLLTVDNTNSDLVSDQQLSDADFFYAGPNTALATNSPSMITGSKVTLFDDNNWRTIARFSVQLLNGAGNNYNNFGDVNPQFAFREPDVIVFRCEYTWSGFPINAFTRDGNAYQITNKTLTMDVPADRELAGYYFTGTGDFDETARWNNALLDPPGHPNRNKVPGSANNAIIDGTCATTSAQTLDQLQVKNAAVLSVTADDAVTDGQLTLNGILFNDGQFMLNSTANGDGSFIDNGTISGTGINYVARYLTSERWHYVSPPISDGLSGIFYDIYLKEFHEVDSTWFYIVPVDIPLNPMQGYGAWADDFYTGTTTVYYEGTLNTGSFNIALTNSAGALHNSKGYNFVGNPYPSAVDWEEDAGWTKSNLDNSIYLWNPAAGNYGSYTYGTPLSGTNDVDSIIPGGQGFFVHVTDGNSTGSLAVNNSARLHNTKPFFKSSDNLLNTELKFIKLQISTELNSYFDQTIMQFNENATGNYDPSLDAYDFEGLDEAAGLYFVSEDNANLSLNTYPELDENIIIPLYCTVGIDGYYTIDALSILNFSETTEVLLEDKFEEVIIDLQEQNAYTFFAGIDDDPNRFNLRLLLTPNNTIEISDNCGIQIYASDGVIYLKRQDANTLDGEIRIFDLLGRLIVAENIEGTQKYETTLDNEGIFLVTFSDNSDRKEYRQKVHLK